MEDQHINPMTDNFIRTTLQLIDQKQGSKGVNLRMVAKEIGCAHTNVYNYFDSFEQLLWEAYFEILKQWVEWTKHEIGTDIAAEGVLDQFIASQIDFALDHPGWYRFIWMEKMAGHPPTEIRNFLMFMQDNFIRRIAAYYSSSIPRNKLESVSDIVHSYLHGEIMKMISGRTGMNEEKGNLKSKIIKNIGSILEKMVV